MAMACSLSPLLGARNQSITAVDAKPTDKQDP